MRPVVSLPRRPIALAVLAGAALLVSPLLVGPVAATEHGSELVLARPGESVLTDRQTSEIAPGLELTTFTRLDQGGWTAGQVLSADLDTDGVSLDYHDSGTVTEPATVRSMAESSGATVAINGDFYDIDRSFAPTGVGVDRTDGLVTSPVGDHTNALAVGTDGLARLAQVLLEGTVTAGDAELALAGVNTSSLPAGGIGLFTPRWGDYDRGTAVGTATPTAEVTVTGGVVASVSDHPGEGPIAAGDVVLVGREAGAEALLGLSVGTEAEVNYGPRADFGEVAVALGGNEMLVDDGTPRDFGDTIAHPRTAVGIADGGEHLFLVVIDGRQAHARGMTLTELAQFMADLGAEQALNLDGGGSSTLVVREPATEDRVVVNSPSDGFERQVANGLGLFTDAGSGRLTDFRVTAGDGGPRSDRVFPGLTLSLTALGHDETFAPVEASPRWRSSRPTVAAVDRGAGTTTTVRGVRPGTASVTAWYRAARGVVDVTVLGDLQRIEPSTTLVALADADTVGTVQLTGYDLQGYRAPIDPSDVEVSGGAGVVEIGADGGSVTIHPVAETGSALLTMAAAGVRTQVAVTVGLDEVTVADFSDAEAWTVEFARATGDIEAIDGPDGRRGVRLSYDFVAQAGNTRAAYATPPAQFELPGQPQEITAWVEGDGNGTWIRMRVYDRNGTLVTLNGGFTTFTGWQQLAFPVPVGTEFPLTFRDIYAVQVGTPGYHGSTGFSDIAVKVAPDVELPARTTFPDPVVTTNGTADGSPLRIAVMNDAQFVGSDPDSDIVAATRRTLREIVAADPDVLVINGDLVDEASVEDFDLARRILDEELAGDPFPWYYVPGNHEVQGGPLQHFVDEFGATQHTVDVDGTRIITLNSAFGTLRAGGNEFDQLVELRRALDEAADSPELTGVLVFAHHPPNDPLPAANSQLADRREAALIEQWLAEFEAESGKSAAYVAGHAGVFHAESVDGVPYVIVGNSGKSPASTPDNGGFTGWTMLGVDPELGGERGEGWLFAENRARVDAISVSAPAALVVGESGEVAASVEQDEGRIVPVAWPVSSQWGGDGVFVGAAADAPRWAVVAVDPAGGTVTALRSGTASVTVTVNGETATHPVTVSHP